MTYDEAVNLATVEAKVSLASVDVWEHTGDQKQHATRRYVTRPTTDAPPKFDRWTKRATVQPDLSVVPVTPIPPPPAIVSDDIKATLLLAQDALHLVQGLLKGTPEDDATWFAPNGPDAALDAIAAVLAPLVDAPIKEGLDHG